MAQWSGNIESTVIVTILVKMLFIFTHHSRIRVDFNKSYDDWPYSASCQACRCKEKALFLPLNLDNIDFTALSCMKPKC